MSSSPSPQPTIEWSVPAVRGVSISRSRSTLTFELQDGRAVTAPLNWFARLRKGTDKERGNWQIIGAGYGVHWPALDEDISVESLVLGRRSMESERSFQSWLNQRKASRSTRRRSSTQ